MVLLWRPSMIKILNLPTFFYILKPIYVTISTGLDSKIYKKEQLPKKSEDAFAKEYGGISLSVIKNC